MAEDILLKKITFQDFKNYICDYSNVNFTKNCLIVSSNGRISFNLKELRVSYCIIKIKRENGNGIITVISNNNSKEHVLISKSLYSINCEIGIDGILTINRTIRSKGEVFISEILCYNQSNEEIPSNIIKNNSIYNSDIIGFNIRNCYNSTINNKSVIITNRGNYIFNINNLELNTKYSLTLNIKCINGNGKVNINSIELGIDNEFICTNENKQYNIDFTSNCNNACINIKRPKCSKGDIQLFKISVIKQSFNDITNIVADECKCEEIIEETEMVSENDLNLISKYGFSKVIFFNFWHKGDLHVSRSFVKYIQQLGFKCEYWHKNDSNLLNDIDIIYKKLPDNTFLKKDTEPYIKNNILYINTWYWSDKEIFEKYNTNFECLYYYFAKVIKKYFNEDILTKDIWQFFPEIDYEKFNIKNAKTFLDLNSDKKKIFISNGDVYSDQCENFNFSPIITSLANNHKDCLFFVSNRKNDITFKENVIFTDDIINSSLCDLNENSYIASRCDVIIGRGSGTYTYSMTKTNYQRKCKFIIFLRNNNNMKFDWFKEFKLKFVCEICGYTEYKIKEIFNIIDKNI